jgi:hypothetical protein
VAIFRPTKAMTRARFLLQRNCPPHVLQTLKPEDEDLPKYLAPYPVTVVRKWSKEYSQFWLWLLTPCDFEPKFLEAKELALSFYTTLLKTSHLKKDPETGEDVIDKTILNAKIKVAERLVGSDKDKAIQLNISQSTQNLNTGSNTVPELPSKYKKNPGILEHQIKQLREARIQTEDQILNIGEAQ